MHYHWYRRVIPLRYDCTILTYLLTYFMVQSPSWAANWLAASQEIPRISRNPKVHYRTHKRPPHVSILGQPNPVHIPTSHVLKIHPNIIHPSTPRSPHWFPSLRFPQQDPIHPPLLTHTCHMPSPMTVLHQSEYCYKKLGIKYHKGILLGWDRILVKTRSVRLRWTSLGLLVDCV